MDRNRNVGPDLRTDNFTMPTDGSEDVNIHTLLKATDFCPLQLAEDGTTLKARAYGRVWKGYWMRSSVLAGDRHWMFEAQ